MVENMWQKTKAADNTQTKDNPEKQTAKHSKTKLPWFSHL